MSRYSNSGFGIRDLDAQNHWCDNMEDYKIKHTVFINCGGNGATTSKEANGRCSRTERMMGLKAKGKDVSSTYADFDIIGFYYGKDNGNDSVGRMTKEEISHFVDKLFIPLFTDEEGMPIDVEDACKNFSDVIFVSHCYGSQVVNELMQDLSKKLLMLAYNKDEVSTILSHSFHFSYSPLRSDSYLPYMQVNSMTDSFNVENDMYNWYKKKYGHFLNGVECHYDVKYCNNYLPLEKRKECHNEISLYTSRLVNLEENSGSSVQDEHSSIYLDLDYNWGATDKAMGAKNSECVSRLSGLALASAGARAYQIHNKICKPSPFNLGELYNQLEDYLQSFNISDLELK